MINRVIRRIKEPRMDSRLIPAWIMAIIFDDVELNLRLCLWVFNRSIDRQRIVVYAPYALHNVQILGVRMAIIVEPGLVVKTCCVHDECISLPLSR